MLKNTFALLLLTCSLNSYATPVTFQFGGVIEFHGGLSSDLHDLIPVGQAFSGSYTFDTSYSNTSSIGSNDLSYSGAISNFTVTFGDLYASIDNGGIRLVNDKEHVEEHVQWPDDPEEEPTYTYTYSYSDTYIIQGRPDHPALSANVDTNIALSNYVSENYNSGYYLNWIRLDVEDDTAGMLNSALLSGTPPDITGLDTHFAFGYSLDCCTGETRVYGTVNYLSVTPVPVPAAAWLFGSSLIGLASIKRKKS